MLQSKTTFTAVCTLVLAAIALLFGSVRLAQAQSSRKDDIVFNSRGVPLAGATVRVCTMPATGQPCTPLALIYSDSALTQAMANPTTSDGLGNYHFYAAPGKYMIEISGPGITTKQIPDVVLPMDPNNPTFSGAISAFSLSLSGNLTVNGDTTVVGNLASGTLRLTNQSVPPGAASAGTVNLYTKADKRLYYKDDTGTEIGPISNTSGAQTNVSNTFTAPQNIDADFHTKGPNPYFDLLRFGGYASSNTPPSTTGSIAAGSTTLALGSAQDFANGQGIVVYQAGPATPLSTPPQIAAVTPTGIINGTTTYTYTLIAEDRQGGLTAAPATTSTTAGAATLGVTGVTLTSASRTSGITTYTCASNCNIQSGSDVNICGFGTGGNCATGAVFGNTFNGQKVVTSTPSSTTFTVNDGQYTDATDTTGAPQARVMACNVISLPSNGVSAYYGSSGQGATNALNVLRYWLYQNGSGPVAVAVGNDPWFRYCGTAYGGVPSYVPGAPPASAQPGYLATTIASGGGTTSLTLANAAGSTASSATTLHDNSPNLKAAVQAAYTELGGTVYIPTVNSAGNYFVFNSTLDLENGLTINGSRSVRILNAAYLWLTQPWIVRTGMEFEGEPKSWSSFDYVRGSYWQGTADPIFLVPGFEKVIRWSKVNLSLSGYGQIGIDSETDYANNSSAGLVFDDVNIHGGTSTTGYVLKGGFDFFFNRGNCESSSGFGIFQFPCIRLTNASSAVLDGGASFVPGRVKMDTTYFSGTAIQIDSLPNTGGCAGGAYQEYRDVLYENQTAPFLRINIGGSCIANQFTVSDILTADAQAGVATPLIDVTNSTNVQAFSILNGSLANGGQPLFIGGGSNTNLFLSHIASTNIGSSTINWYNIAPQRAELSNSVLSAFNGGRILYQMALPAAPQSAVISSGGSVPLGTHVYAATAVDTDGKETIQGQPITSPAVTSGNQTVTVTLPATFPAGAAGLNLYRDGALVNAHSCLSPQFTVPGGTDVDSTLGTCGVSAPNLTQAGSSALSTNGVSTYRLTLGGEVMNASPRAEQSVFLPGALTSTWTASTWTADKALTITRIQVQAKTAPAGCTTNAVVRLTDGATPVDLTVAATSNDSGAIAQNYAAGASLQVMLQTAAAGCSTSPADANVIVQYRMQ